MNPIDKVKIEIEKYEECIKYTQEELDGIVKELNEWKSVLEKMTGSE